MHWSEGGPVEGALAAFAPEKDVPKFKLTNNAGAPRPRPLAAPRALLLIARRSHRRHHRHRHRHPPPPPSPCLCPPQLPAAGRSELMREVNEPTRKRFYEGWCALAQPLLLLLHHQHHHQHHQ